MTKFKKSSHLRSILKGISWRIIATADTALIVLTITCMMGDCSIENAIKISVSEFLIKLGIYYFHERIWLKYLGRQAKSTKELLSKTISWRILATTTTFIISGIVLKSFTEIALFIALAELITKLILYYAHEKIWLNLPLGKIRKLLISTMK